MHPDDAIVGTGHIGRGLGKGGGVLLTVTASFLVEDTTRHHDGNCTIVVIIYGI